jgi:chemotaxis methyl-accepting protein methylase
MGIKPQMTTKVDFTKITNLLSQISGWDMGRYEGTFLSKSLEKQIHEKHCASIEDYYVYLEQNHEEGVTFIKSLQIHFSEFFRDPLACALLERVIIPELILKKKAGKQKEIRIWSAGCAAGQEAYTVAILLDEAISSTGQNLNYRIFATDLDQALLDEARLGRYHPEAIKNINLKRVGSCFTRQGEDYVIKPSIQQHIDFSIFNLFDENRGCPPVSIFGDFDLVFCCNLLIYYQPEYRNLIFNKFSNCIVQGGYLVTGEAERAIAPSHHFSEVYPQASIFRMNKVKR